MKTNTLTVSYFYKSQTYDLTNFSNRDELIELVINDTIKWEYDIQLEDITFNWNIPEKWNFFLNDYYNSPSSIKESYFEFLHLPKFQQVDVLGYLEEINPNYKGSLENLYIDYYYGEFSSMEEFASYYVHKNYQQVIDTLPSILQHLNYTAIANDLFIESFDYVKKTSSVFIKNKKGIKN